MRDRAARAPRRRRRALGLGDALLGRRKQGTRLTERLAVGHEVLPAKDDGEVDRERADDLAVGREGALSGRPLGERGRRRRQRQRGEERVDGTGHRGDEDGAEKGRGGGRTKQRSVPRAGTDAKERLRHCAVDIFGATMQDYGL